MPSPHWFQRLLKNSLNRAPSQHSHCDFKSSVPPPPHTHILVLSLHSKCQAVTSTIVSRTRWSLLYREKGRKRERKKAGVEGELAQTHLCAQRTSHFLPVIPRHCLWSVADREAQLHLCCRAAGRGLPSGCPLIMRGCYKVYTEWELCLRVASSCLQLNEMTLCENLFYERLVYL